MLLVKKGCYRIVDSLRDPAAEINAKNNDEVGILNKFKLAIFSSF